LKLNPPLFYNIFLHLYELVLEALQAVAQLFWEQIGNYRTVTRTISVKLIVELFNVNFYGVTHVLKMVTVAFLGLWVSRVHYHVSSFSDILGHFKQPINSFLSALKPLYDRCERHSQNLYWFYINWILRIDMIDILCHNSLQNAHKLKPWSHIWKRNHHDTPKLAFYKHL